MANLKRMGLLQGQNQVEPTTSRIEMVISAQNGFYGKRNKKWRILSWEEFGIVFANPNKNYPLLIALMIWNNAQKIQASVVDCNVQNKKKCAHCSGRTYFNLEEALAEKTMQGLQISVLYRHAKQQTMMTIIRDGPYCMRVVISMNCIQFFRPQVEMVEIPSQWSRS